MKTCNTPGPARFDRPFVFPPDVKWTPLREVEQRYGARYVECRCECGLVVCVQLTQILHSRSRSCRSCGAVTHGETKNGRRSSEFVAWKHMRIRCNNKRGADWANYGGRGIKVCERWNSFENFLADMGRKPSPQHSIDRIDVDGNYEPGNVRWATPAQQGQNKRLGAHNMKLTPDDVASIRERSANGETRTALAREFGVTSSMVSKICLNQNWKR